MIVQAMSLFKDLTKKHGNESEEVVASRGWFSKFKARTNLRNVKVQGEAASADHAAASAFPDGFGSDNLGEGGADQMYNVGETGLSWKCMPEHTCIVKIGHKAAKECFFF